MNGGYQPKLNRDALLQGYVGADPKAVGLIRGYTQQQVDRSNIKPDTSSSNQQQGARRPNPYIK